VFKASRLSESKVLVLWVEETIDRRLFEFGIAGRLQLHPLYFQIESNFFYFIDLIVISKSIKSLSNLMIFLFK